MPKSSSPVPPDRSSSLRRLSSSLFAAAAAGVFLCTLSASAGAQEAKKPKKGEKVRSFFKGLGEAIDKMADTTAQPSGATATDGEAGAAGEIGATGTTGSMRHGEVLVQWTVVNDGSNLRPASAPAAEPFTRDGSAPCGPSRACAATADLRVVSLNNYRQKVVRPLPLPYDVTIENHGRTKSAVSEVVVCKGAASPDGKCGDGSFDSFELPALAPGERITARRELSTETWGDYESANDWAVVIDPDQNVADANRANNVFAARTPLESEHPVIERQQFQLPERLTHLAPIVMVMRLRNAAQTVPSGSVELAYTPWINGMTQCSRMYGPLPFLLPSLPAKAVVDVRVTFPAVFRGCKVAGESNILFPLEEKSKQVPWTNWSSVVENIPQPTLRP